MRAGAVIASAAKQSISLRKEGMDCFAEPVIGREQPIGQISPVGWVEPFAKPIIFARQLAIDGYRFAPPILRANG